VLILIIIGHKGEQKRKICEDCKTRQKKTALTFRESEVVGKQTGYVKSFFLSAGEISNSDDDGNTKKKEKK